MSAHCDIPVSWLRLEQFHLGELDVQTARVIGAHVDGCPGCRHCLDSIENDTYVLPPLPVFERREWGARVRTWMYRPAPLALSAVGILLITVLPVYLAVFGTTHWRSDVVPPSTMAVKGGVVEITSERNRDGEVTTNPTTYTSRDRFHLTLTCPFVGDVRYDVAVFQGDAVFFPMGNEQSITCGNEVPLSGAFALTGNEETTVCVMVFPDEMDVSRTSIRTGGIDALPLLSVCTMLSPEEI